MTILLSGGTGFIGTHLVDYLVAKGHRCIVLVRRDPFEYALRPGIQYVPISSLNEVNAIDGVINLAGENVAGRWTERKKQTILDSRIEMTRLLVDWMRASTRRPSVFLSASAIGIYGDRPGEVLTEASAPDPKNRFRCRVCRAWEEEALRAEDLGVRTVTLRTGNVLDLSGGPTGTMLPYLRRLPFLAPFAPEAITPWISLTDTLRLIEFALGREEVSGPLNVVGPNPLPWRAVLKALGRRIKKPVIGSVPDFIVRTVLGEFAQALLESQDVRPAKALAQGFQFTSSEPFEPSAPSNALG